MKSLRLRPVLPISKEVAMRPRPELLLAATFLISSACAARVDELSQIGTVVAGTMQAEAEMAATVGAQVELTVSALSIAPITPSPSESPTMTPIPTEPATPTPELVTLSVSANTNCRSGPGTAYDYQGTLLVGETAEASAISSEPNYWYIANPNRPGEFCWLWGEYATALGDTTVLPVYTPRPRPTAALAFTLQFYDLVTCGGTLAVFKVHNTGPYVFMTGHKHVIDLDTSTDLSVAELDRHPFAPGPSDCPPGHDNRLEPDQVAFIFVPLFDAPSGHTARGTVRICTEDYLGGVCFSQRADFKIP